MSGLGNSAPVEEIPFPALSFAAPTTAGTAQSPAAGFCVDEEPPLKCGNCVVETCYELGAASVILDANLT